MRKSWLVSLALGVLLSPCAAQAVEYRLRVANLTDPVYFHFAEPDRGNRDSPFSMQKLRAALDGGTVPLAGFVWSRDLVAADVLTAQSFRAVALPLPGEVRRQGQWQEVRWEGRPGERTVWVVRGEGVHHQAAVAVSLTTPSTGQFRHYHPYTVGSGLRVEKVGRSVIDASEGRDDLWRRYLGPRLDLKESIAGVVGENYNSAYPDAVYFVIEQPSDAATYSAVIGWRHRERGIFNPSFDGAGGGSESISR